jgi:hypothetical protein
MESGTWLLRPARYKSQSPISVMRRTQVKRLWWQWKLPMETNTR